MKEKILEIIGKSIYYGNYAEVKKPLCDLSEEITAHVMKFIEWLLEGNDGTFIQSHKDNDGVLWFLINTDTPYATLNDVYDYWLKNVKE